MHRPTANIAAFLAILAISLGFGTRAYAQGSDDSRRIEQLTTEVAELKAMVLQLQKQVAESAPSAAPSPSKPPLSSAVTQVVGVAPAAPPSPAIPPPVAAAAGSSAGAEVPNPAPVPSKSIADRLLDGFTINGILDTYYEYNANEPIGRVNYLRAYDVSSNNFSLNQADLILESAPDSSKSKPFGVRIDFQYGQATATLQGNPANELRPEIYRNIYQAYGTYIVPIGNGLNIDFGKWASSLGLEGNYTKDQFNYSRSFWFNYLPFYHTGLRLKYPINDQLAVNFWITNGTQQTEAFNNYKDQLYGLVWTPSPKFSWVLNYYRGQEHPDVVYVQNPGPGQQDLPEQQGTYFEPIPNPPTGLLNIGDTYVTWQVTGPLTLAAEADYVEEKLYTTAPPEHVSGGAGYAVYQFNQQLSLAARGEYLADQGGLFSGVTQDLKEATLTLAYRPAGDGFLIDLEYRRDWSNQPYFLSSLLGVLEKEQPTIGFGVVWWFGQKQGAW